MHELLMFVGCFGGAFLGNVLVQWLIARSRYKWENAQLYAWIESQARPTELGPHRSMDVRALVGVGPAKSIYPLECGRCGASLRGPTEHNDHACGRCDRPPKPAPTTVPSGGRYQED